MHSSLWRKSNSLSMLWNRIDHQTPFDSYFYKETIYLAKNLLRWKQNRKLFAQSFYSANTPFPFLINQHDIYQRLTWCNCHKLHFSYDKSEMNNRRGCSIIFFSKISKREGSFECFWRIQFISGWICWERVGGCNFTVSHKTSAQQWRHFYLGSQNAWACASASILNTSDYKCQS